MAEREEGSQCVQWWLSEVHAVGDEESVPFYHYGVPRDGMTKERERKITRLTPMFQDFYLYPWSV